MLTDAEKQRLAEIEGRLQQQSALRDEMDSLSERLFAEPMQPATFRRTAEWIADRRRYDEIDDALDEIAGHVIEERDYLLALVKRLAAAQGVQEGGEA
jgi:hypothetical protein